MKINWNASFQIAAVYVGTVVGAGFATGKEIVEFFSRYGFLGLLSIAISGYLFIFLGSKLMRIAASIHATSFQELNEYLFGRFFGRITNLFMLVMLLGVCAVMLSGAGAVFEEQIGLSRYMGIFITIGLAIIIMSTGVKGLFAVNGFVVPIMIVFSFMLLFISMKLPDFYGQVMFVPPIDNAWKVIFAPFSYAALNLTLAQAVLIPVASEIKDDQTIKWGGILGGAALTLILFSSHMTLVNLAHVEDYEIPMAVIMKTIASSFFWIYVFVIYGEIFTTIIGNAFGIERQIKKYTSTPSLIIICIIFIITFFISLINYGTLLSIIYPLFGYMSLLFIFLLSRKSLNK